MEQEAELPPLARASMEVEHLREQEYIITLLQVHFDVSNMIVYLLKFYSQ